VTRFFNKILQLIFKLVRLALQVMGKSTLVIKLINQKGLTSFIVH